MDSKNLTRSEVLARIGLAPIAIGAFAAMIAEADAAAPNNQKQFKYQNKPKGSAKCSKCALFLAPHSCSVVTGTISPNGWCVSYSPKH